MNWLRNWTKAPDHDPSTQEADAGECQVQVKQEPLFQKTLPTKFISPVRTHRLKREEWK